MPPRLAASCASLSHQATSRAALPVALRGRCSTARIQCRAVVDEKDAGSASAAPQLPPRRPAAAGTAATTGPRAVVPPRSATAPGSGSCVDEVDDLAQHLGMVLFSSWALAATTSVAGLEHSPQWAVAGACLGGLFAALHRHASVRLWRPPSAPLRIVITGGTRGLGKALARESLVSGDAVLITGRCQRSVDAAVRELKDEAAALRAMHREADGRVRRLRGASDGEEEGGEVVVHGVACDVSDAEQVRRLGESAAALLGGPVDAWVLNAGQSGSFKPFLEATDEALEQVVKTNLLGGLLCAREAARRLSAQPNGGHLFLMDGAGADGAATPYYAAYGATKAALPQLAQTLRRELQHPRTATTSNASTTTTTSSSSSPGVDGAAAAAVSASCAPQPPQPPSSRHPVGVHVLSPGMMLTDLLLDGASQANKQIFNILCEQPETVAAFLVPRLRTAVARGQGGTYTRYLTPATALWRFLTAPARVGRFFGADGVRAYPSERERILGRGARASRRARAAAAARGGALRVAYSLSVAASAVAVVAADAVAKVSGGAGM